MEELELLPWDKELRHCNLRRGDLVLMKSGHYAIVTNIRRSPLGDEAGFELPPHVEVFYCDDTSPGSCSIHRVEKIIPTGAK
jgi:hypothetical protein